MSWFWGSATNPQYEELVEKACSPLNLPYPQSEDIALNLEITDMIRSKAVLPKPAMQSLKRRIADQNGRVKMYAISLVDTCIKNGGDHFLAEIASKEFVDEMSTLIRSPITNAEVKQMALKHFQAWALAFESKRELAFLVDVYRELKSSGMPFPPPPSQTSSHLLDTTTAPAWIDSDVCMRCRSAFTFTNRKHHCRNCGLVYDQACSSRMMPLPRFGIKEPVRVCESCFLKNGKVDAPAGPPPAVPGRTPRTREDLDADLQRAIELSLAESQPQSRSYIGSEPPLSSKPGTAADDDEELRLAIEASLREMEKERPSAPEGGEEPDFKPLPTFDLSARETETILTFSNTMDQMTAYGERDLSRFPYAHVLAQQAHALSGKLQRNAEEKTTKQQMLAEMQDKLSQAVTLYGQILDGQQAYSARQYQEAQQRQYQAQQNSYAQYVPPQTYQPQMNGHASPYPSYAPPQQAKAGPSLYPSMPNLSSPPPQPQYYQVPQQNYGYEKYQPVPATSHPAPAWSPAPQQRAEPYRSFSQHEVPRQASRPQVETAGYTSPVAAPSAPPPVDRASHPASSPTSSVHTVLPQISSPTAQSMQAPLPPMGSSPGVSTYHSQTSQPPHQYDQQPQQEQQRPQQQYSQSAQPQYQQQPQQHAPQQQAPPQQHHAQAQYAPANTYSVASFPSAPSAVFPDAPSMEPQLGIKQEKEEALLIEL